MLVVVSFLDSMRNSRVPSNCAKAAVEKAREAINNFNFFIFLFFSLCFEMAKLMLALIKTKFVAKTIETGKNGEEQALTFLKNAGYVILHTNWRFKHLEIDI